MHLIDASISTHTITLKGSIESFHVRADSCNIGIQLKAVMITNDTEYLHLQS